MSEELTLLKAQADTLGLTYSNNIGLESLKKKVADHLNGTKDDGDKEEAKTDPKAEKVETAQERTMRIRAEQTRDETKLIRVRIVCMNPDKAELKGEFITVGNKYIGVIRKFVPFGDHAEAYHLPKILVDDLKARQFNQVRTRKVGNNGQVSIEQRLVNEYSIEILPPLTPDELKELARMQAAAAGQGN